MPEACPDDTISLVVGAPEAGRHEKRGLPVQPALIGRRSESYLAPADSDEERQRRPPKPYIYDNIKRSQSLPCPAAAQPYVLPERRRGSSPAMLGAPGGAAPVSKIATYKKTMRKMPMMCRVMNVMQPREDSYRVQDSLRTATEPPTETFVCPICTEREAVPRRILWAACADPEHAICRRCAFTYVNGRVLEMRIESFPCPVGVASGGCGGLKEAQIASEDQVVDILLLDVDSAEAGEGALARYRQFKRMKADKSLRSCPGCWVLCAPVLDASCQVVPNMECQSCNVSFCYYHSWAHQGEDCTAYAGRLKRETEEIAKSLGAKDCPKCTRQTEKAGGCNHMTCQQCHCEWCWICEKEILGQIGWHYSPNNPESGCLQFSGTVHPNLDEVREVRRLLHGEDVEGLGIGIRILRCSLHIVRKLTTWWIVFMFALSFLVIALVVFATMAACALTWSPVWLCVAGARACSGRRSCRESCRYTSAWCENGLEAVLFAAMFIALFLVLLTTFFLSLLWLCVVAPGLWLCFGRCQRQVLRTLLFAPCMGVEDIFGDVEEQE